MKNQAIAHITEQMMQENNPAITVIEEYLTNLCTTEEIAEKLLQKGKTLKGALKSIEEVAKKRSGIGCVCIPDEEGFAIVRDYYGITVESQEPSQGKPEKIIDIMDLI